MDMSMSNLRETVKDREDRRAPSPWGHKALGRAEWRLQIFSPTLRTAFCLVYGSSAAEKLLSLIRPCLLIFGFIFVILF